MLNQADSSLRGAVMEHSLYLEKNLSIFLKIILGIEVNSQTTSFERSEALMLNSKINLLIDTNFITDEHKNTLKCFMRIRNVLMHDIDANTATICLENIKGNFPRKRLINEYINEKHDNEEKESRAIILGVLNKVSRIVHGMVERIDMYSIRKDMDTSYVEYGYAASLVNIDLRLKNIADKVTVAEFNELVHQQIERNKEVNQHFIDEFTKAEKK